MFDFLKNVSVASNKKESKRGERVYSSQELNPTNGADLRVFKDGRVYPSEALVKQDNLEYGSENGQAYDVFASKQWAWFPSDVQAVVFIAAVPKTAPKADLFKEAQDNTSVLDQGSKTFGKNELIQMLADAYTEGSVDKLFGESKYVDLVIVRDVTVETPDGIYLIPKKVSRGEDKGKPTFQRRENITLNPLGLFVTPENPTNKALSTESEGQVLAEVTTVTSEVAAQ